MTAGTDDSNTVSAAVTPRLRAYTHFEDIASITSLQV